MTKIFECIYAYIYKFNYAGSCSLGKQVYTLTSDLSPRDIDVVTGIMPTIDNVGVAKIDAHDGVKLVDSKINPDYDMVSFAYYPTTRAIDFRALCRFGMRQSLKDLSVRGTREIAHALIFDGVSRDKYVVDYMDNSVFDSYKDIQLDTEQNSVDDSVCEVQPSMLDPLDMDNFSSYPLASTDIYNLGPSAVKSLAEIVNAIIVAKTNRKTAFIVYDPEDWELAKEYIKIALKLFPAHVANEFSFVTCYGRTDSISVDICGVPTRDDDYISMLQKKGYVVRLDITGATGIGGDKVPFADFLSKASNRDLENWLDESANFYEYTERLEDVNDVIKLYLNRGDVRDENTQASLRQLTDSIGLISRNLDLITKIPYECRAQVNSIKYRVEKLCAEIQNISSETLFNELFLPVIRLLSEFDKRALEEKSTLIDMVYTIIFGNQGQSKASTRRHFEFISFYSAKIMQELTNCRLDIADYMQTRWGFLRQFFEDYFGDTEYVEYAASFGLVLLQSLLRDLEREGDIYSDVRDYFVSAYLSVKSNQLVKILDIAFAVAKPTAVYKYATNTLLRRGNNVELYQDRVATFTTFLIERNLLATAIPFYKEKFVAPFGTDLELVETILNKLLQAYILPPSQHTMDEIYTLFKKAQSLLDGQDNIGLQKFIYDDFAKRIINPLYAEAIKRVRFEDVTEADMERYRELLNVYNTVGFAQQVDRKFCPSLEELLVSFQTFLSQTQREAELVKFRVDFVARELLLLDKKTILKVLYDHIGEVKVNQQFEQHGISEKPLKHERFLKVSEIIAREFLSDNGHGLSESSKQALADEKVALAKEIRETKSARNKGSRMRRLGDSAKAIISSTILAAVMAVIVAVVGYLFYNFVANGYFISIYLVFTLAAVVLSETMYWYNYSERRKCNIIVRTAWQTAVILVVMMGLFIAAQFVLQQVSL
ncbi:MAG: hypothetical protein J1G02_06070 [Clostridiales bacterium]|nr:hypothetical protein [Clostridiales bacterium]